MVIIVMMTVMITIPNSKFHGANTVPAGADRTQVGPMLATWTPAANWDNNGNLAKKEKKEKSEYFKFVKIAWMAPGN